MPEAWDITTGGMSVRVGVAELGSDLEHPDIELPPGNCILPNGQSGVNPDDCLSNVADPNNVHDNHGTHVLGIIGARSNDPDAEGITGIMWEKDIRVARPNGTQVPDIVNIPFSLNRQLHLFRQYSFKSTYRLSIFAGHLI